MLSVAGSMAESPPAPAAAAGGGKNDSRWSRFVNSLSLLLRQFVLILGKNFLLQVRKVVSDLIYIVKSRILYYRMNKGICMHIFCLHVSLRRCFRGVKYCVCVNMNH